MANCKRMKIHTTAGVYTAYREEGFRDASDVLSMIHQRRPIPCECVPGSEPPLEQDGIEVFFNPSAENVIAIFDVKY